MRLGALRISSFTCFLPLGLDVDGRGRLHLLDLLGGGEAAAQQVAGRASRADEATGVSDNDSLSLLLLSVAVLVVVLLPSVAKKREQVFQEE